VINQNGAIERVIPFGEVEVLGRLPLFIQISLPEQPCFAEGFSERDSFIQIP
jgi:hypothetical protein